MLMNLAFDFGESFIKLFAEMTPLVYVLFILGLICCIVEIFIPGFGVFGILGIIMMVAAIIIRMVEGGDAWMLLVMLLFAGLVFIVCFIILAKSGTKGRLSRTIFNVESSVPEGRTAGTDDFSNLLGKEGVAATILRPVGQADINGRLVDVIARGGFIDEGEKVKVVETEGQRVVVERIKTEG